MQYGDLVIDAVALRFSQRLASEFPEAICTGWKWRLAASTERPARQIAAPLGVNRTRCQLDTYHVYTMNMTIALSDDLVARVREVAQRQGTTLNELVRRQFELVAGRPTGETLADEMRKLWAQSAGRSVGERIRRSDAYDRRRS